VALAVTANRFDRRRLIIWPLLWDAGFTVATGLTPDLGAVNVLRFLAALGVGAEYAIVNAAIAELIPARVRGKANAIVMNFWPAGAIAAGLLAYLVLDTLAVRSATPWRYLFVFGGLLALVVLFFRRRIPESPQWLVARGRHDETENILTALEARPEGPPARSSCGTVHQPKSGCANGSVSCSAITGDASPSVRCSISPRRSTTARYSPSCRWSSYIRSTSPTERSPFLHLRQPRWPLRRARQGSRVQPDRTPPNRRPHLPGASRRDRPSPTPCGWRKSPNCSS